MPYVYSDVENLDGTDKVGSKQCVALIQHYARAPNTGAWKEGSAVFGSGTIAKGTAKDGSYLDPSNNADAYSVID